MSAETCVAPKASIIIPAFNVARDIAAALESVFAQSFDDYEVIVVNDGSTDDLTAAIRPFRSRLLYLEQPNRGAAAARNAGIRAARGRYVAFLDADDVWQPALLDRQIRYLDARPACDLVYSDALISGDSPLAGQRFMQGAPSRGPVTLMSLLNLQCNVILSTVVVRRQTLLEVGLFDESIRRGHDFDLWLRMTLRGAILEYHREVLAERRTRIDGLTGDRLSELQRPIPVLTRFAQRGDLPRNVRLAVRLFLMKAIDAIEVEKGKRRLIEGNFPAARYHLAATRRPPLKIRLALLGLHVAPAAVRRLYAALHPKGHPGLA
jgi:glycosyltransferase involved in cell wall biosynthesis